MQMNITQPARLTFWRFLCVVTAALPLFAMYQLLGKAREAGVDFSSSRAWTGLMTGLGAISLVSLLLFAFSGSRYGERILSFAEFPERASGKLRWLGILLVSLALTGFIVAFMVPFMQSFFGALSWVRVLVFWSFSLIGMWGLKFLRKGTPWFNALIAIMLCQSTLHLLLLYWPRVTDYPFAMGWSEVSRYYYSSFFFSKLVYGQRYPWPIQNSSLHLLLSFPYLFDAPLWFHRFWRVALGYLLVAAIAPALLKRLSIPGGATRWLVGLWIFLYLYMGPIYTHLTIPVIIVLLGFSSQNDRRTWLAVLLASFWSGWSRVNWYPMPGIMAAILYFMEAPLKGKNVWRYLLKPALWFVVGTLFAFLSQRLYIALSGITDTRLFYTSFISNLLWYRLWPNSSFSFGVLPGLAWVSLPMAIAIYMALRARKGDWHPIRLFFIFAALFVIMVGGIIVSLKIGGGANLHNMDGYFVLLLIITTYLVFARYRTENGELAKPISLHWLLVLALIYSPLSTYLPFGVVFPKYDQARTQKVLTSLQEHVDAVNAQGGEILFITQKHLISLHMLKDVKFFLDYEREDLMEMAMSNNQPYLEQFTADMNNQRFALIVIEPLNYNLLARRKSFSEENNAWMTQVVRPILCNYRAETVFPEDDIALYVPQQGARQCP